MSKEAFYYFFDKISQCIAPDSLFPNVRAVTADKKLAVTSCSLGDTGSIKMTANLFGIYQSTLSNIFIEVCNVTCSQLGPKFIYLPKTVDEIMEIAAEFEIKYGVPQVFGCIDSTHIPKKHPQVNSQVYFNYKMFHSINVQDVCDSKGRFVDINCRWLGSVHDTKVFANSNIRSSLASNFLPITFRELIPGTVKVPNFLIGDPAYPLTPYCLKRTWSLFKWWGGYIQQFFKRRQEPNWISFWSLKNRWAVQTKMIDIKLENILKVVNACFILHNFCEARDDTFTF